MATRTGFEFVHPESALPIEIENLLRLGDLERETSDPIHHIEPRAHAASALLSVMAPGVKRLSTQDVAKGGRAPESQ